MKTGNTRNKLSTGNAGVIVSLVFMAILSGCATGKLLQTEEGRTMLLESPEIKEVLSEAGLERIDKWCAIDPLLRFAVRLELTAQRLFIPILSDVDSCRK